MNGDQHLKVDLLGTGSAITSRYCKLPFTLQGVGPKSKVPALESGTEEKQAVSQPRFAVNLSHVWQCEERRDVTLSRRWVRRTVISSAGGVASDAGGTISTSTSCRTFSVITYYVLLLIWSEQSAG